MPNFEIYDDDKLVNIIVADSLEIAKQVTGLMAVEQIEIISEPAVAIEDDTEQVGE